MFIDFLFVARIHLQGHLRHYRTVPSDQLTGLFRGLDNDFISKLIKLRNPNAMVTGFVKRKERNQEIQILELHIVFTADIRCCFPKLAVLLIRLCFDISFLTRKAGLCHSADQLFILFR